MQIPYIKMHGTGNQILLVDQRCENLSPPDADTIRQLGDDASGPGFDALMWIGPDNGDGALASYRVFNTDGSEVEQCGNGVRCVAKYLAGKTDDEQQFWLASPAGPISAKVFTDGEVAVSMGAPVFEPASIPFVADTAADTYPFIVGERQLEISAVSMGNPHCVLLVPDAANAAVGELGPLIEHHERFPQRTNIGFMSVRSRNEISLRVHERGVGETAACGTGACAAVACGRRRGLLDDEVTVDLPGGQVVVSWRGGEATVWLKGNAELIDNGMINLQE